MKVLAAVLCLSLLVAAAAAQKSKSKRSLSLAVTCGHFCNQTCDFVHEFATLFAGFLGPVLENADALCRETCGFLCGNSFGLKLPGPLQTLHKDLNSVFQGKTTPSL